MAEVLTATKTQVAITAGRKVDPTAQNRVRQYTITTPAAWSAAQNDTAGSGIVLAKGTRLAGLPVVSCAAGTAATTLSVGLRNPVTKVAIDATAIVNAAAINAASTSAVATGTKLITGQDYTLTEDAEIYWTFGGGIPLANQAIRVEGQYVAP